MNFGYILYNLQDEERSSVRRVEKLSKKLLTAEYAVIFNKVCIKEKLLPNYTDIKPHDPAARRSEITLNYRRELLQRQLEEKKKQVTKLEEELQQARLKWEAFSDVGYELRQRIDGELEDVINRFDHSTKSRILKKLSNLNGGPVLLPQPIDGYVNLSDKVITANQRKLLNLGLNCHTQCKINPIHKRVEIETLIDDVLEMKKNGKVTISDSFITEMVTESKKSRGSKKSRILDKDLITAAKELKENKEIVIRRADKSSIFVILEKDDYLAKMNELLSDTTKFKKTSKDTTLDLKSKVNKLIDSINAKVDAIHFQKIVGDFKPGYAYGNVKIHKPDNPLRLIVSQIPTPTYQLAKRLNHLLTPYVPSEFSLKSSEDFIDIIKNEPACGFIASLDVSSLFTNVPVDETIDMIINEVYYSDKPRLDIPEKILRELLIACTKEAPFRGPDGHLYLQVDGVAMGSPLGVLFANFYMGMIERKVMENSNVRPRLYGRYIDDTFVEVRDYQHLDQLKREFEKVSSLIFTHEVSNNGSLPFLDTLVSIESDRYITSVYTKNSNLGMCMNGEGECPQRYKRSVISAYVRRAISHCSSWTALDNELQRATQVLVNNDYSSNEIQREISRQLSKFIDGQQRTPPRKPILKLYYRNYMSTGYKVDERILTDIVKRGVKPTNEEDSVQLTIYYKNKKTSQLVMKNNLNEKEGDLSRTGIVYQYTCPIGDCKTRNVCYIGMSTTTLSRRLTYHLQNGTPKNHTTRIHNTPLTRQMLVENTVILDGSSDRKRLQIQEALFIDLKKPEMNVQIGSTSVPLPSQQRHLI